MSDEVTPTGEGLAGTNPPPEPPAPEKPLLGNAEPVTKPEGEGQTGEPAAKPDPVIPEKYEFAPIEGFELNPAMVEAFTPMAQKLGLTNEAAQELAGWYAGQRKAEAQASAEAFQAQAKAWTEAAMNDKEFGGKDLEANVNAAEGFIQKYGTPEFAALLKYPSPENPNGLGLGNHPEVLRLLVRLSKATAEDGFVPGGKPATEQEGNMFLPGSKRK